MKRRWLGLVILGLIGFFAFLNQSLLGLLLEPVKHDLGLSDTQIGLLNGLGVAVFFTLAAFPIGWLADRYDRRLVLAGCIVVWSLSTAACGFATSFAGYSAGAIAMAMGEAALIPIVYAMIPPMFAERERPTANAIVYAILVASGGLGLAIGGVALDMARDLAIAATTAPWRILFVGAGLLGIPLIVMLALVPAPVKAVGPSETSRAPAVAGFAPWLRTNAKTIAILFLALSLYGSAWAIFGLWTPAILARVYGYDAAEAGKLSGIVLFLASLLAVLVAWWAMRRQLPRWGPGGAVRLVQWGCWSAVPPILALPFASNAVLLMLLVGMITTSIVFATALAPMICQDIAPNIYCSRTIALFPLIAMVPRAIAPSLVGMFSDWGVGTPQSLLNAVFAVCIVAVPLAIILLRLVEPFYGRLVQSNRLFEGRAQTKEQQLAPA